MTPQETTERIRAACGILEIVGRYVTLRKSGTSLTGLCPFHREQTPSFRVDPNKQRWKCFGCNLGGDVFDFVARIEGTDFKGAKARLADIAGIALQHGGFSREDVKRWAAERCAIELNLPAARLWRRAAVSLAEELLHRLKAALVDETAVIQPYPGEIVALSRRLARWRTIDGADLVGEFQMWRARHAGFTCAMVQASKMRQTAESRALRRFVSIIAADKAAA